VSRRRDRKWKHGEVFGTSLADILTTALGCVLLLFLVAVMNIRQALSTERAAHERTQEQLVAEESGRHVAEREKQVVQGAKSALEQALLDARAARGEAERALRASEEQNRALEQKMIAAQEAIALTNERLAATSRTIVDLEERHGKLRQAANDVIERLDPGQTSPVDLMLVIDGTRSMAPSLDAVRRDLASLMSALGVVSSSARVGVVVFRDRRESKGFRIEEQPLTDDMGQLARFLSGIQASSTRVDDDLPEWLLGGMERAAKARFREDAVKLMVVVSDAATQDGQTAACEEAARRFLDEGGRVFVMSTLPSGHERREVSEDYEAHVLPEHAAIATAGGGIHLTGTGSDTLVHEALRATLRTRAATPLDALRRSLDADLEEPAEQPAP
jgi:hypothetical protein